MLLCELRVNITQKMQIWFTGTIQSEWPEFTKIAHGPCSWYDYPQKWTHSLIESRSSRSNYLSLLTTIRSLTVCALPSSPTKRCPPDATIGLIAGLQGSYKCAFDLKILFSPVRSVMCIVYCTNHKHYLVGNASRTKHGFS